ncbi:MAG: hypothetical protein IK016_02800 [Lachnospiraceae bacterium]|nr:hypothetical protein [Lachnospiraceae bacterium]
MKKTVALLLAAALVLCACAGGTADGMKGNGAFSELFSGKQKEGTDNAAVLGTQTITVASASFNTYELEEYIRYFNNSQDRIRAEFRFYSEPSLLLADLAAGNAPDVLDLQGADVPLNSVNFVDLAPLLEADAQFTNMEFSGNILSSLKTKDSLLALVDGFSITTLTGRSADVGLKSGWKMEDAKRLATEKGNAYHMFHPGLTAQETLLWFCYVSLGQMVDRNAGQCHFDTEAFTEMLKFCAERPRSVDSAACGISEWDDSVLLVVETVANPARLEAIGQNYAGQPYTFIGFPNADDNNGAYFESSNNLILSIPTRSTRQEAAWMFLRGMLEDGWQARVAERWELPVIRSALDRMFDDARTSGEVTLSDAETERFYRLLEETTIFIYDDNTIREIIMEEAEDFLAGVRNAEDTAALIQNRVTLYLQETY